MNPLKLDLAERLGATHSVDARAHDPVRTTRDLTHGRGADVSIEAAGKNVTIRQALEASRPGGRVVILGKTPFGEEVSFPFMAMMGEREIVRTSYGMSRPRIDFPKLADLAMRCRIAVLSCSSSSADQRSMPRGLSQATMPTRLPPLT